MVYFKFDLERKRIEFIMWREKSASKTFSPGLLSVIKELMKNMGKTQFLIAFIAVVIAVTVGWVWREYLENRYGKVDINQKSQLLLDDVENKHLLNKSRAEAMQNRPDGNRLILAVDPDNIKDSI